MSDLKAFLIFLYRFWLSFYLKLGKKREEYVGILSNITLQVIISGINHFLP